MYRKILFKKIIVILLIFGQIAPAFSMEPEEEVGAPRGGQVAPDLMESEEKMEAPRGGIQRHSEPEVITTINKRIRGVFAKFYYERSILLKEEKISLVTALVIISPKAPDVESDEISSDSQRFVPKRGYQHDKFEFMEAF
jgi:hypothetical protein